MNNLDDRSFAHSTLQAAAQYGYIHSSYHGTYGVNLFPTPFNSIFFINCGGGDCGGGDGKEVALVTAIAVAFTAVAALGASIRSTLDAASFNNKSQEAARRAGEGEEGRDYVLYNNAKLVWGEMRNERLRSALTQLIMTLGLALIVASCVYYLNNQTARANGYCFIGALTFVGGVVSYSFVQFHYEAVCKERVQRACDTIADRYAKPTEGIGSV